MKYPVNTIPIHTGIDWTPATPVPYPLGANDQYWSVVSNANGPAPMCAVVYDGACPNIVGSQKVSAVPVGPCSNNVNILGIPMGAIYTFRREIWIDAPAASTFTGTLNMDIKFDDKLDEVRFNGTVLPGLSSGNDFCSLYSFSVSVLLHGGLNSLEMDIKNVDFGGGAGSAMYIDVLGWITIATPPNPLIVRNDYFVPNTDPIWGCAPFNLYPPLPNYSPSCVELPTTTGQLTIGNYDPAFTYSINNGGVISPTGVITTQSGTTYTVTVTDAKGCAVTNTAQLNAAPPMVYTLSPAHSCLAQGSVQTLFSTVTGGTPGFLFGNPGSNPSGNVYITSPGVYSVTVVDQHGCFATATATVGNRFDVQLTANNPCMNANGGASVITASTNPAIAGVQY
jgi:hypothetical protein